MNSEPNKVNVLAVLKRHADLADQIACGAQRAEAHAVHAAVIELADVIRSAREWHLGDKYRFGDASEQLAWKDQLALYDNALAKFK